MVPRFNLSKKRSPEQKKEVPVQENLINQKLASRAFGLNTNQHNNTFLNIEIRK